MSRGTQPAATLEVIMLHDVMAEVVGEKKASTADKKHYIPFSKAEFQRLRVAFNRPDMMPNDIKLVLLGIADGQFDIVKVKPTT